MNASFFQGTKLENDRAKDKFSKEKKKLKFPPEFNEKVDIKKVNLDVIKMWITNCINDILKFEDELVIDYTHELISAENVDPKDLQVQLTGFLEKDAPMFVKKLWNLLLDAQKSDTGIPSELIELAKKNIEQRRAEQERLRKGISDSFRREGRPQGNRDRSRYNDRPRDYNDRPRVYRDRSRERIRQDDRGVDELGRIRKESNVRDRSALLNDKESSPPVSRDPSRSRDDYRRRNRSRDRRPRSSSRDRYRRSRSRDRTRSRDRYRRNRNRDRSYSRDRYLRDRSRSIDRGSRGRSRDRFRRDRSRDDKSRSRDRRRGHSRDSSASSSSGSDSSRSRSRRRDKKRRTRSSPSPTESPTKRSKRRSRSTSRRKYRNRSRSVSSNSSSSRSRSPSVSDDELEDRLRKEARRVMSKREN